MSEKTRTREHISGETSFYAMSGEEVLQQLDVRTEEGLSEQEVSNRREEFGRNRLEEETTVNPFVTLLNQFKSIVILIMVVAALAAFVTARWPEAMALVAVILINTAIGFLTEYKAVRSMAALRRLGKLKTSVRRAGREREIAAVDLVPGDIVLLQSENLVPADLRLTGGAGARLNEAALTGESVPVNKSPERVEATTPLHDRTSMLYKGTTVEEGEVEGVVTATGPATELGRIARLTAKAEKTTPPLQKRLDQLGRRLAWITLAIATIVGITGLAAGRDTLIMIETAIALGIAAIPEGLPIVATIALARGMWLMARHNALVNRLSAVETLGATSIIFTDKTGTLTENSMVVRELVTPLASTTVDELPEKSTSRQQDESADGEKQSLFRLLKIAILCSNVERDEAGDFSGDPTEVALAEAATRYGLQRQQLQNELVEEREVAFDSKTMLMATFHRQEKAESPDRPYYVAVKGAPGAVMQACERIIAKNGAAPFTEEQQAQWRSRVDKLAARGLRLLAFADKGAANPEANPYERLCFIGLAAMEDPPRTDVRQAIEECQEAGIRVVMVTGDRADTGSAIGDKVGIAAEEAFLGRELGEPGEISEEKRTRIQHAGVFARVTPKQKYLLVKLYQDSGQIVAMTGDGINDTPALKQADIGIAMGLRGTDAAKQVADMVLRDDNFSTVVKAVREGRIIFANIRKSVLFMLCTNIAEILVVTLASVVQLPIPLRPLQILYLNVLTDVFPALALGVGPGSVDVMKRPPRQAHESVLTAHHWRAIAGWSVVIGGLILGVLSLALYLFGFTEQRAVTVSFLTLAFSKMWFVLNLRDRDTPVWKNDVIANRWMWAAWGLCLILLCAAAYFPPLASLLQTVPPGTNGWTLIISLSLVPAVLGTFLPGIRFYSMKGRKKSTAVSRR